MSDTRKKPAEELDPVVVAGDVLPELRVQFWEVMSLPLLRRFMALVAEGDLGAIDSLRGAGRAKDGRAYSFHWRRGGRAVVRKAGPMATAGCVILTGRLDFETVNRIRNFPLFHIRSEFCYVG